jgi:glycosyltransferase involved in cell wall biosynthesis
LKLGVEHPVPGVIQPPDKRDINFEKVLRFVFIGTLIPDKGIDVLIRAFRQLEKDHIRLRIYGRDDIAPVEYRNLLRRLSAGDERIEFLGPFDQAARASVYSNADVVIIPSRAPETFSIVAHEALAFGVPVIASDIGALPEVILPGVNGYLVTPGDTESLHVVLEMLSNNPGLLTGLEIPGPVRIYSIYEHGEEIEKIYRDTVGF